VPGGARLVDLVAEALPAEWMALSVAAHWNQTEDDWRTMLALGRGWGLRCRGSDGADTLVASTLVLPYEQRFAWISMVLVLPAWRGHGLAARLLGVALEHLAARCLLPVLDATPAGRPVYLKQGFADRWGFERWRGRLDRVTAGEGPAEVPAGVRPVARDDWPALLALDTPAFGAERLALLQSLATRLPGAAWLMRAPGGRLRGYVLGRPGRTAWQLGPAVLAQADDAEAAQALLAAAIGALVGMAPPAGEVVVDLRSGQGGVEAWLRQQGFVPERPFTRMVRDAHLPAPGEAGRVLLVAGPELG